MSDKRASSFARRLFAGLMSVVLAFVLHSAVRPALATPGADACNENAPDVQEEPDDPEGEDWDEEDEEYDGWDDEDDGWDDEDDGWDDEDEEDEESGAWDDEDDGWDDEEETDESDDEEDDGWDEVDDEDWGEVDDEDWDEDEEDEEHDDWDDPEYGDPDDEGWLDHYEDYMSSTDCNLHNLPGRAITNAASADGTPSFGKAKAAGSIASAAKGGAIAKVSTASYVLPTSHPADGVDPWGTPSEPGAMVALQATDGADASQPGVTRQAVRAGASAPTVAAQSSPTSSVSASKELAKTADSTSWAAPITLLLLSGACGLAAKRIRR